MRLFSSSLLIALMTSFFLLSCGGETPASKEAADNKEEPKKEVKEEPKTTEDPTTSNPEIAKMSEEAKAEMDKMSANACKCLSQHGEELSTFVDEALPMLKEAQNKENTDPMEVMGKLMGSMAKMKAFGECFQKVSEGINEEMLDAEMKTILGEDIDPKVKDEKQMEIINAFLGKNCPKEQQTFQKFIDFGKEMQALQNKGK
ncbi:hypothetical protein PPO43_10710 [Saprospira sp. CCB-QB6]|uniref:hypothetical protein n=1 Tax=Saprospira sp. CCB-QB6 TaxID=3023936 RepID=UPI00234BD4D9|nr:hypothetical protein [Saprospira sp. CCB-QB6]WCL80439.1 hypothetical protein PPO43_10710 [Saprospira sp. CCB-QB6]